jgi:hypothetical protein
MKMTRILIAPVLGAIATMAYAKPAHAAPEYVIILLDETGSMCTDSVPCMPTTGSFWLNAIDDAKLWVAQDAMTFATTQRFYSIWTFKNTQDGVQTNAVQLWPTATFNTNCTGAHSSIDGQTNFCGFKANDAVAYTQLQTVLESIKTMTTEIPQPTWLTPLADGICRGLSSVWGAVQNQNRTLILESDGGENDSLLACMGPVSTTGATTITPAVQDWGFTVGSWEANVLRRAARLTSFDSLSGGTYNAAEASAVAAGPLGPTETIPPGLTMKVSIQYALCAPGQTDPACPVVLPMAQSNLVAAASTFGARFDGDATADVRTAAFAAQAVPAAAPAATTTPVPSTDPNELGFFRALGKATKNSKEREVVRDPTVVYGVNHKLAGDVDDSGCVDHADFSIVTQSDVWMQRAVQPLQIAIRADLNRDGWVNEQDRAIVLANWGKGCINPVGPKPVIQ